MLMLGDRQADRQAGRQKHRGREAGGQVGRQQLVCMRRRRRSVVQIAGWCFRFFFLPSSPPPSSPPPPPPLPLRALSVSVSSLFSVSLFSASSLTSASSASPFDHFTGTLGHQQFKSCRHTPHTYPRPSMAQKLWKPGTIPVRRKQTCRTQCETCRESERVGRWLNEAEQDIFLQTWALLGAACFFFPLFFFPLFFCFVFFVRLLRYPRVPDDGCQD